SADHQAVIGFLNLEMRLCLLILMRDGAALAMALTARIERTAGRKTMQIAGMEGIEIAFHRLQVIAFEQALADEEAILRQRVEFELREFDPQILRPHIGPDDPRVLLARIGRKLDAVLVVARRRL